MLFEYIIFYLNIIIIQRKIYRYIFAELNVYDQLSKTTFKSNGQVSFDDLSNDSTHDVYYLDQFSFNIP